MEQVEFNNIQDTKFSNYFFDIENLKKEDLTNINSLIKKYPYCQALYLLAARSAVSTPFYDKSLATAAVSVPSRNILYNFIHHPSKFKGDIIKKTVQKEIPKTETLISIIDEYQPVAEELRYNTAFENTEHEDEVFDEITSASLPEQNVVNIHHQPIFEISNIENLSLDGEKYSEALIEEEIVEETATEENLTEENVILEEANSEEDISEELEISEDNLLDKEPALQLAEENLTDEALPYIENIEDEEAEVGNNEPNVSTEKEEKRELNKQEVTYVGGLPKVKTPVNLSKYDDERLPYTFLWWLSKTRKTYKENLRPYATFSLDTTQEIKKSDADPLEHQIAENIFHINSANEIESKSDAVSTVAFDFMKKEHQIIEKFIKEEPQIKPPPANKIDTENKAKKSSEDSNELVSETLAKVYVEQMLFHKALEVYRKLSLKYPEKSTYFASQIKYLELKVN